MRNANRQAGFSLLELMTALVVMGVVTAQLFIVMGNQKKVFSSNQRVVDAQETARMTLDLISFDTRMGGYMIPSWDAVSSVDGGDKDPDRFCVSSMFIDPGVSGSGSAMESVKTRWTGSTIPVGGIGTSTIRVDNLDINLDGTPDFTDGQGVIVASKSKTFCAHISTAVPTGGGPFLPGNPIPGTITITTGDASSVLGAGITPDLMAVPANVYELDKDALQLNRNGMLLASQIEDFQVEFWVDGSPADGNDDGDTEFPVNDLNNPDPPGGGIAAQNDRVRRVRITVLAVSPLEDNLNAASGHLSFGRPQIANRLASDTPDRLRRRAFSASIMPRNVVGVSDPEI